MKRLLLFFILLILSYASAEATFKVSPALKKTEEGLLILKIHFEIPENHYLYADKIKVKHQNEIIKLSEYNIPEPVNLEDQFSGKEIKAYTKSFILIFKVDPAELKLPLKLKINYQGCNKETCFLPESENFELSFFDKSSIKGVNKEKLLAVKSDQTDLINQFQVKGQLVGYLSAKNFIKKLDEIESSKPTDENTFFESGNFFVSIFLIILGGLALNLTPCVLPVIPINLAIIGAGARAGSKLKGFLLGSVYALGMALSYGTLGLIVVLTGSTFGSLNSSPWFNFAISGLFIFLSLGMLGVINIDFSRFRPDQRKANHTAYFIAFFMGAVSSLLAGACVAPVVLAVLILSSKLFSEGNTFGVFLPFLLGTGMGLPWPFLGAGLTLLPKPGQWMEIVKKFLSCLIFLFALYYAKLGVDLFKVSSLGNFIQTESPKNEVTPGWYNNLNDGLKEAHSQNMPVLVDFWASWCKNCLAMNKTTFKDESVLKKLDSYVKIKFQAENPGNPLTKGILDHFDVKGLPTIIIMEKKPDK